MVAAKFVENVVKLHGLPRSILSDRDPIFLSNFWKELWKMQGTTLRMSSAYHPQTDGQTEVVNRCIEQFLRCFVQHKPKQWSSFLPWAEYWYNTSFHARTGTTPFHALYGRPPPSLPRYEVGSSMVEEIDEQLLTRDKLLDELKHHLETASNRMKQQADRKRRDVEFMVDEWVFLRLQPYRQKSVFKRSSQKLANRFFGPFQVEKRIGEVAYKLKLPAGAKIHPVFHVSLLKKRIGDDEPVAVELPPLRSNGTLSLEPEEILSVRQVQIAEEQVTEVLVHWKGLTIEEATWEDYQQLKVSFPYFNVNLEGKVLLDRGSIDRMSQGNKKEEEVAGRTSNRKSIPNKKYLN